MAAVLRACANSSPPSRCRKQPSTATTTTSSASTISAHDVWVTRKGAVRAGAGDLGIIPGSMGAKSYIVRGLGNAESFQSCAHGAGREMSRGEAKRRFTLADHVRPPLPSNAARTRA